MTSKRYPESRNLSRSHKIRLARPFPDHYTAAQPPDTSEEHPVDVLIDNLPGLAARRRKLRQILKKVQRQMPDQAAFIGLMDARFEYATLREQAYFNVGFEHGLLAGRAESQEATTAARDLAHQIGLAVATTNIPQPDVAAALMAVARAVVLGLPLR